MELGIQTSLALVHFKMSPLCGGQDKARDLCGPRSFYTALVQGGALLQEHPSPPNSSQIFWIFPIQHSPHSAQPPPLPRAPEWCTITRDVVREKAGADTEEVQICVLSLLSAYCVTLGELPSLQVP